jgi:hypothetical protein
MVFFSNLHSVFSGLNSARHEKEFGFVWPGDLECGSDVAFMLKLKAIYFFVQELLLPVNNQFFHKLYMLVFCAYSNSELIQTWFVLVS